MRTVRFIRGAGTGEMMDGFIRPHGPSAKKMVDSTPLTGFAESTASIDQKTGKKKNSVPTRNRLGLRLES